MSAYTITKIKDFNDSFVTKIGFDSQGNTYVATNDISFEKFSLYKFGPSNEIVSVINLNNTFVNEMLFNSRGDMYLNLDHTFEGNQFGIVRSGSTEVTKITSDEKSVLYERFLHLHNDGHLFF